MSHPSKYDAKFVEAVMELMAAGQDERTAAASLGTSYPDVTYAGFRKWWSRYCDALGMDTYQVRLLAVISKLGLYHVEFDGQDPWEIIQLPRVQHAIDNDFTGISIGYVIQRPPEMRLVYMNDLGRYVYNVQGSTLEGTSLWDAMATEEMYSRIKNLDTYHLKSVRVAKTVMEIGKWLGKKQMDRVEYTLANFVSFAQREIPTLWENEQPDVFAFGATYSKVLSHWDESLRNDPSHNLTFNMVWNWRPAWQLFQVRYFPTGNTIAGMTNLLKMLRGM